MKKVKITVKRITVYDDLSKEYENPVDYPCCHKEGEEFISQELEKPKGFCDSAWSTLFPFVKALALGGEYLYDGWMKDPRSVMISCNDGFRPVTFLVEAYE